MRIQTTLCTDVVKVSDLPGKPGRIGKPSDEMASLRERWHSLRRTVKDLSRHILAAKSRRLRYSTVSLTVRLDCAYVNQDVRRRALTPTLYQNPRRTGGAGTKGVIWKKWE